MIRFLFLCLFCLVLNATSLKDVILNTQNSELANIKKYDVVKSELNKQNVLLGYLPSISIGGGYKTNSDEKLILRPKEINSIYAKLDFLIYDGGAREARIRALSNLNQSEIYKNDEYKNYLSLNIVRLYYNALSLVGIIKAKEGEKNYLSATLERLKSFKDAGLGSSSEYESILAKYYLSLSEELELKQKLNKIKNSINLLSNTDVSSFDFISLKEPDYNISSDKVQLKAMSKELFAIEDSIKESYSEYLPHIFLQNTFMYTKSKLGGSLNSNIAIFKSYADDLLKEDWEKNNEFMIGFKWKIFDFGSNLKKIETQRVKKAQAMLNLNYKKRENELSLKNIKQEIQNLKDKILANELYLKSSQTSLKAIDNKYKSGLVGYNDFLLSLANEFGAKSSLITAKNELEIKKAEYYFESGVDILERIGF
ncbi:type I secretion system, outer membrane protein, TolC family [Campylobacter pinnipediorum subsp. caledonicus]|uniref:Type I secretion system, outer membrane protein, TolC family n=1 Tax=Campylobacter pinnipediorum subsp. caledonicus TaxID=1874362 RepID=A0A1S6U824_9BACT|nr:TolC family protein [Campylobacter pinnipediorum]AQW86222.1 type I secretion system, outer membrane protein, TolC family [Campylobacter pinnipediorum subsp. caledonicus]AQW87830.1 type I secretion system, outer membrane protein, TolC family [Campylobacter pinnipediorum subsp. caledonicus]